jgi:hypothetical protein
MMYFLVSKEPNPGWLVTAGDAAGFTVLAALLIGPPVLAAYFVCSGHSERPFYSVWRPDLRVPSTAMRVLCPPSCCSS